MLTDLAITGKPAQFGRGVMQDVSDKLLGQFVSCLEDRLTADPEPEPEPPPEPTPIGDAASATPRAAAPPPRPTPPARPEQDNALDLGAAVLPVLAKGYWKQALAGLVVVALVIRFLRRR